MEDVMKVRILSNIDNLSYSKDGDAAIDLRASGKWVIDLDNSKQDLEQNSYSIKPNKRVLFKTGIEVAIPKGCWGNIKGRSGHAFHNGIHVLGGVIDENYRGEVGVILVNLSQKPFEVNKNDRVAQMIISEYKRVKIEYVNELDNTNRNKDGFGSTGK